ncbi:MAG: GTPase HflX, partial [Nannocystaceae bacterium]
MSSTFGDTSNLKPAQARALSRFAQRSVPAVQVVSQVLARDLVDLSLALGRQIGVLLDRRGRVQQVILGDAHSINVP